MKGSGGGDEPDDPVGRADAPLADAALVAPDAESIRKDSDDGDRQSLNGLWHRLLP